MSDMYGQYGVFIDDYNWEYDGAWTHYYFDMKNMLAKRVYIKDGQKEINESTLFLRDDTLWSYNMGGGSIRFSEAIQAEYKRYQHWLFERVVLLEE